MTIRFSQCGRLLFICRGEFDRDRGRLHTPSSHRWDKGWR